MLKRRKLNVLVSVLFFMVGSLPAAQAEPNFDKGIALYKQRNFKGAISAFERAVQTNRRNPTPIYYEAVSYQQMGNTARAMDLYKILTRDFPGTQEANLAGSVLNRAAMPMAAMTTAAPQAQASSSNSGAFTAQEDAMLSMRPNDLNVSDKEWLKLPDEAKVPFSRGAGGHLYMNVQVNGRTIPVIFDTGAEMCAFGKNHLAQIGITPNLAGPKMQMGGVGDKVNVTQPMIVDLRAGDITRHMAIMVQDNMSLPPLLGQTFFAPFQYDIDSSAGVIHFTKKQRAGMKSAHHYERLDTIDIPFQRQGNEIVVMTKVNGHECPMYFDTGASHNFFSMSTFMGLGMRIPDDAQGVIAGGVGGNVRAYQFRIDRLELGPIQKTNVQITVAETGPPIPLLGQPFFGDKRFTIDNDKNVIHFMR